MDGVAHTKLDVLSSFAEVEVCIAYRLDGKELDEPPIDLDDLVRAQPVYTTLPGWGPLPTDCRELSDLPITARRYVESIERWIGTSLSLVSVGPERTQTIVLRDPFV
jgi:adenylosuccinate synthase